jgi:hypothetical protein
MGQPQVISASRRTDIPAFFAEWFDAALTAGKAAYKAPYTGKPVSVSLAREEVAAFVFWTRNPVPLLPALSRLEQAGYPFVFHYTVTGLPTALEPHVPPAPEAVRAFSDLSRRVGPGRVLWRFDPILPGEEPGAVVARFESLSAKLEGFTRRCTVSLAHPYRKSVRATRETPEIWGMPERLRDAVESILRLGARRGIRVVSCCSSRLAAWGVPAAPCIDGELLRRAFPGIAIPAGVAPSRPGCLCSAARDIGSYRSCRHGCRYCYAA